MAKALFILLILSASPLWAKEKIPWKKIPKAYRAKAKELFENASVVCKVTNKVKTTKFIYQYLLDRLIVSGAMLKALKLANYKITRGAKGDWTIDDNLGAKAVVHLLFRNGKERIYFVSGRFKTSFCPVVKGQGLVILTYLPKKKNLLLCTGQFYFRFENSILHRISKTLHKLFHKLIDKKAQTVVRSAQKISQLIYEDPKKIYKKIKGKSWISKKRLREYKLLFIK